MAINDVKTKKITFFGYLLPQVQQSYKKIGQEAGKVPRDKEATWEQPVPDSESHRDYSPA